MTDYQKLRDHMVDVQIARRGVRDAAVLKAMRVVPRERFVREGMEQFAYEDSALPIEEQQTISQPYIVAVMIEAAEIGPDSRVLEVGAGSGYAACLMGEIGARVFAIERHGALARLAQERAASLGYGNVEISVGDGSRGLAEEAPFDAILVAAGGPSIPSSLKDQLAIGGHLIMPVGDPGYQKLCKITREAEDRYSERNLGSVMFVPLIGEQGWRDDV